MDSSNLFSFIFFFLCFFSEFSSAKKLKSNLLSKIKLDGKYFVDQDGRVMLFHGINSVQKNFPWVPDQHPNNLRNLTEIENLQKWGFNAVRLGYMWSGLYPEKGKINQTYVNIMTEIIDTLASYGIYTLIDLHQDQMSSEFYSYDGVPLWLLNELPAPKHPYPWPFKEKEIWDKAYFSEACCFAFQCFYDNVSNSQVSKFMMQDLNVFFLFNF